MKITFWGATDEVTGSMTFLENEGHLGMVDAGLSQGSSDAKERNFNSLPFPASKIEAVIVTHAHLDHSGYLPRLVRKGFHGEIVCTPVTAEIIRVILEDSAKLSEDEENPLYDINDVKKTLKLIRAHVWNSEFPFLGMKATLVPAGHILGASSLVIEGEKRIVFSGDLGRKDDYLIPPPMPCPKADVVVMESTYGGKLRKGNMREELYALLLRVKKEEKICLVASFALARGQSLITQIEDLFDEYPELRVPLYFDSPMMKLVNDIYKKHSSLTLRRNKVMESLKEVESIDFIGQWNWLRHKEGPFIAISSSGMVSGGRIFRYLENWQDDQNAILFLPGYQGENTPGRALKEGNRVIMDYEGMPITWSGEVVSSEAFSSHADESELLGWVLSSGASEVCLIHGEGVAKEELKRKLTLRGVNVRLPARGETLSVVD